MRIHLLITGIMVGLLAAAQRSRGDDTTSLALVREAFRSNRVALESGRGEGVYTRFEETGDKKRLLIRAKVSVTFQSNKYFVRMHYQTNENNLGDRTNIVFDGSSLLVGSFSKDIMPQGSMGEIVSFDANARPIAAGFPWNPARLSEALIDIDALLQEKKAKNLALESRQGALECRYEIGRVDVRFVAKASDGYNVSEVVVTPHGKANPVRSYSAEWGKSNSIWYVTSIRSRVNRPGDDRWIVDELRYDSMDINIAVSPNAFSLDALGLRRGSRVLDQRPNATQREYVYAPLPSRDMEQVESMLDDLKRRDSIANSQPNKTNLIAVLGLGLLLVLAGSYLIRRGHLG